MKFFNLIPLFLLLYCASIAQQTLSLSDAIKIGLENNFQIAIEEKNLDIAKRNNSWEGAGRYPAINFTLNSNNSYNNQNNPASFFTQSNSLRTDWTAGVNANWTIFDGYTVKINKARLAELESLSQGNLALAVEQSIEAVILAYYQALIQQEQLQVIQALLSLSRDRIAYQEARKEFGQSTTFDLLQTQDAYLNDSTSLLIQQNTLANNIRELNRAMGVDDITTNYNLSTSIEYIAPAYNLDDLNSKMYANNINLQNLLINRELAAINLRLQESSKFPVVGVNGGVNYNTNISDLNATSLTGENFDQSVNGNSFTGFVNLSLTYSIYNNGVRKRNIENAKVDEIIANLNIDDLKQTLNTQLTNVYATYNNQKRLINLTDQLLQNATQNLEIAQERFKGGLINSFDYRTIQLNYINASKARLDAFYNLKVTETNLIRLTGGLVGQFD